MYPPTEVVSLGLSIPTLFAQVLGSEQMFFIFHHMNRILVTLSVHCLLPLGYFIFMATFSTDFVTLNSFWQLYLNISILVAVFFLSLVYYWKVNNYNNHLVAQKLKKFARASTWKQLANQINIEFRRVDKFQTGSLFNRVYVTDNWLIKVSLYSIDFCPNELLDLTLTHANEVNLTQDGSPSTQYLHILVKSLDNNLKMKPFYIRLNSLEYKDFNDKLNRPVREACDIIIKQSLPDQFLDAFRMQISDNIRHVSSRDDVENCVGCMRKLADVKLVKSCDGTGDCTECFCRPMWCLECELKSFKLLKNLS